MVVFDLENLGPAFGGPGVVLFIAKYLYDTSIDFCRATELIEPPFAFRARVKSGVKILDASSSNPDWIVDTEINPKNTAATFTARRKENASRVPSA